MKHFHQHRRNKRLLLLSLLIPPPATGQSELPHHPPCLHFSNMIIYLFLIRNSKNTSSAWYLLFLKFLNYLFRELFVIIITSSSTNQPSGPSRQIRDSPCLVIYRHLLPSQLTAATPSQTLRNYFSNLNSKA